jgi:hypothetical protein
MSEPKSISTRFKKGRKKTGGRKAGVRNSVTRNSMEAVVLAAEQTGSDGHGKDGAVGYLMTLALTQPRSFTKLIGRVMLLQEADRSKNK